MFRRVGARKQPPSPLSWNVDSAFGPPAQTAGPENVNPAWQLAHARRLEKNNAIPRRADSESALRSSLQTSRSYGESPEMIVLSKDAIAFRMLPRFTGSRSPGNASEKSFE